MSKCYNCKKELSEDEIFKLKDECFKCEKEEIIEITQGQFGCKPVKNTYAGRKLARALFKRR